MSTVQQIHHLEHRIDRLLTTLREQRAANDSLRGELAVSQERAAELERQLTDSESARRDADRRGEELQQQLGHLHAEQEEIEATITRTLDQLSKLDLGTASESGDQAAATGKAADEKPAADEAAYDVAAAAVAEAEAPGDDDAPAAEPEPAAPVAAEPETSADNGEGDDLDIF